MHAGLHTPACILNQTFSPLGIPQRFKPVEIRSNGREAQGGAVQHQANVDGGRLLQGGCANRFGASSGAPMPLLRLYECPQPTWPGEQG